MKKVIYVLAIFLSHNAFAQQTSTINIKQIDSLIKNSKTPVVINFWATFCEPCIKELPYFQHNYKAKLFSNVSFYLVSIDVKSEYPKAIDKFLKRKKIGLPSFWLSDNNPNYFMPIISPNWGGSIPATLFINNQKGIKYFEEGMFYKKELEAKIKSVL